MLFQIIKGEYISKGPSFLYVLPDDRDDSNLHCSASEGPGSRRRARMNGAGAVRACPGSYACRRENGPNAPYTGGTVFTVNGHESVVVERLRVYGAYERPAGSYTVKEIKTKHRFTSRGSLPDIKKVLNSLAINYIGN